MFTPLILPTASGTGAPCPAGTWGPGMDFGCTPCPAGTFQPNVGRFDDSSVCVPCPAGTFSLIGASSCITCPAGTTSLPGSTSIDDCEPVNAVPEFGLEAVIMIAILAPLMLLLVRRAKSQS